MRGFSLTKTKVLVTGGTGFIGSHLVNALVKAGCKVCVLDNLSTGTLENIKTHIDAGNVVFVKGDVQDKQIAAETVKSVDAVFHLAAITSVPYSIKNPEVTREVNVAGTMNLLEACLRGDVERFVHVSTCAVYGEAKYLPIDERHPTSPISPYAESKLAAEQCCSEFQEAYGLKTVVLRLFNVYGLRMRNDQYGGVIARFVERLRGGESPVVYGDGSQTRDFVHVEDAVRAMRLALDVDNAIGGTFNIGSGVPTSVNQLAQLLMQMLGVEGVEPLYRGAMRGDLRHSYADVSMARKALEYEPRIFLKEGLARFIACDQNIDGGC
jgi:nucleoside-diphosphate-sugar epimerase